MSDPVPSDTNPFLLLWDDPPRRPTPEMLYVTLDQAYVLDEETGRCRLVFSAVDASWFEALVRSFGPRSRDLLVKLPIFLLEIELQPGVVFAIAGFDDVRLDAAPDGTPGPGGLGPTFETLERRWKILKLHEGGPSGELYDNLFGAPVYVSVSAAMEPSSEEVTALDAIDPLDNLPDATVSDISAELGKIGSIDHVAVYDVGQGGANGLVSTNGAVAAYVDFGGGVTSHRTTFPTAVTQFCFCANDVPIILSHWDADHWSSEGRDRRAHGKTWIVPRQKGTLTKRGFHSSAFVAAIIAAGGRILVWPTGLSSLTAGMVTIWQCLGTSRNGSGLAVTIDAPGGQGDPVLLPADADYHEVPSAARSRVDAVGAPHHGGPVTAAHIPGAPPWKYPRLMYSYGLPNSYKHARPATRTAHHGQGWHDPVASAGVTSLVRNTADLRPHTGHIGFDWGRGLAPGPPTCTGGCPLGIDQV